VFQSPAKQRWLACYPTSNTSTVCAFPTFTVTGLERLPATESVPAAAVVVAVSLDGVLIPMKDGQRERKCAATRAQGKLAKSPTGYNEASCGTLMFYDRDGEPQPSFRWPPSCTLDVRLEDAYAHWPAGQQLDLDAIHTSGQVQSVECTRSNIIQARAEMAAMRWK